MIVARWLSNTRERVAADHAAHGIAHDAVDALLRGVDLVPNDTLLVVRDPPQV